MTMPDISIEDRVREEREPHLENLLRDVKRLPGYYKMGVKSIFSRNPGIQEWRKVVNKAIADKLIVRDMYGKFWLTEQAPSRWEAFVDFCDRASPIATMVGCFAAFSAVFAATMVYCPALIATHGLLGYFATVAGMVVSFLIAGAFYIRVWS